MFQRRITPTGEKTGEILPRWKKNSANTTRCRSRGKVVDRGGLDPPTRITAATPHIRGKLTDH
ncbi:MAG: hypothetical protein ACFFCS_03250 [Candidatus Hodarchaeota archaeon]